MIFEQWIPEVISSRMVPLKWTRRDDMHCSDEVDPLWKPLLANSRMVFIAYLVLQAKNSRNVLYSSRKRSKSHTFLDFFCPCIQQKRHRKLTWTRQSEMANTSPRPMPVLGNVHPIKIGKKWYFFRDVISLLARVFILLIDTATQEVPMKNIWRKLSVQFLRYAIELLHVKRRTRHKWR